MRNVFAGLMMAIALFCGVTLAQNAQREGQAVQPGGAVQPGRAVQPGAAAQPGAAVQPGAVQPRPAIAPRPAGQQGQPGQPGQGSTADQQIAACVYGECRIEIEVAKLAESKATSDEVREFAQRMVRDHTPGCQQMQRLAGSLVEDNVGQPRAGTAPGGGLDFIAIHKEIGQQCLKSIKEELSSKQGIDFDKCFIGQQIGAHLKVVDMLTVLRNHASGELKQDLEKELQTAQQHLQLAKQIEQKLKDHPSERVSRRPDGNK